MNYTKVWIRVVKCLMILAISSTAFAQQNDAPLRIKVLGTDGNNAYITVVETARPVPVRGLSAANFRIENEDGQQLTIESVAEERRPLHVVAILDVTSSVTVQELFNQKLAVVKLIETLQPGDEIALVTLTPDTPRVPVPLTSDHTQVIAELEEIETISDESGNSFWDALYGSIALLQAAPSEARQVIVLLTDTSTGSGSGEHSEADIREKAEENHVEIFALYFVHEADSIPEETTAPPPELTRIAAITGGIALSNTADVTSEGDYTDDQALPIMMETITELLNHEYHLILSDPVSQNEDLAANAVVPGSSTAASIPIEISFTNLNDDETISQPFMVALEIDSPTEIALIQGYAIHAAGDETALGEITPENPSLLLEGLRPGSYQLRIVVVDRDGNRNENSIRLNIPDQFAVYWLETPPTETEAGETLTLQAHIGRSASVDEVVFTVNDEVAERLTEPPFETVSFEWEPEKSGEYELAVIARSQDGSTASQQTMIEVTGGSSISTLLAALGISVLSGMILSAFGLFMLRRKHRAIPVKTVEPVPPTQRTVVTFAAVEGSNGEKWRLVQGENTIGRHGSNMIQLMDESTSRHHAKIECVGTRCFYIDWQASHPSEINGVLLEPNTRHELHYGDAIRVGSTLLKFIRIDEES